MQIARNLFCLTLLMLASAANAMSLRFENLSPDGWYILIESRDGSQFRMLANAFIGPWKKDSTKIEAHSGDEIYVSVHKTRQIEDNRERQKLKLNSSDGTFTLHITAGSNGEPKISLFN